MGQNIRPIQQILHNLENSRLISSSQYEHFLKDYQSRSNRLDPVYEFFKSPGLDSFLRYYVLCKYEDKQENVFNHLSSRKSIEDQLVLIAETHTKQKFISYCKILLQSLKKCKKKVCQLLLSYSVESAITVLNFFANSCLDVEKYQLTVNCKSRTITYKSKYNTLKENDSRYWQQKICSYQKGQYKKMKAQSCENCDFVYYFRNNQGQYLITITFLNAGKRHATMKCLQNTLFKEQFQYFIVRIANNIQEAQKQSKRKISLAAVYLISLKIHIHKEFMKEKVQSLFFDGRKVDGSWLQLIYEAEKQNEQLRFTGNETIKNFNSKIEKQSEKLKEYLQLIEQNQCFLDFNQYSQLSFCYIQSNNQVFQKLVKCWAQNRIKIIDILGDSQILMDRLSFLVKSMSFEGTTVVKTDNYTAKIYTGKNSMLQRLQIFFHESAQRVDRSSSRVKQTKYQLESASYHCKKLKMQEPISKIKNTQNPKREQQNILSIQMVQHKDLNTLSFSASKLTNLISFRMKQNSFLGYLIIKQQNISFFNNFIKQVIESYQENHNFYHNLSHVSDVLNLCSFFTTKSIIKEYLSDFELFCIQLAALCHDIGNRGFTNRFQIESSSDISIKYNDFKPLQNFAASKAIKLLKEKKNNFLESLQNEQYRRMKKLVIQNILNTDHWIDKQIIEKFKNWRALEKEKKIQQSTILSSVILNISEQSSWSKDFSVVQIWSSFLYQQLSYESSYGSQLGLSHYNSYLQSQKSWNYFLCQQISTSILPLYKELYQIVKDQELFEMIQRLKQNIAEIKKVC